jgi:hypothetical protein
MCEKIFNQFLFFSYHINKFYSNPKSTLCLLRRGVITELKHIFSSREGIDIHQISGRTYATIRPSYQILVRHKCTIELQT